MRSEALPTNPLGQRLCELFTYRWKWLEKPLDNHQDTDWSTNSKYPLKARVLWTRYQDAKTIIGVRFGSSTRYALIDIDANSPYIDMVQEIREALEMIGITRTITLTSSWSGGLHIYVPLAKDYPTFSVACVFKQALEAQGFQLAPGELEVFPNVKNYARTWLGEKFVEYNGHRLPLQPGTGSRLLTDDLEPVIVDNALSRFFALWENAALLQDDQTFRECLAISRNNHRNRPRMAKGPVREWQEDLEYCIAEGWTGPGQTNALLKDIGTYGHVFERLSGNELVNYIERIATSRPGYEKWCRHQHEIKRRATLWAGCIQHFYWPLGSTPLRDSDRSRQTLNRIVSEDARERIEQAFQALSGVLNLSIRQLAARLVEMAKCSLRTLYKHKDLWHPGEMGVTVSIEGFEPDLEGVEADPIEPPETTTNQGVTPNGGENEVWSLKSTLQKIFTQGKERGCGGEKGISTDQFPDDWHTPEDWGWPL